MTSEGSRRQFKNIDEYIATFPENVQHKLRELRSAIKESAPEAEEAGNLAGYTILRFNTFGSYGFYGKPSGSDFFFEELLSYRQNLHLFR